MFLRFLELVVGLTMIVDVLWKLVVSLTMIVDILWKLVGHWLLVSTMFLLVVALLLWP